MDREPVTGAVNQGSIPNRIKPTTESFVFTAFLLDAQYQRGSVKNKPASSLVVPLGKALSVNL